ncbi:MAG: 30S ribosomal protein S8 [Opitutales bacterium]
MAIHDTIGDFLTVLRNASLANKDSCAVQYSKVREGIARILKQEGYIEDFARVDDGKQLEVRLKYVNNAAAITGIQRFSKPGRRMYYGYREIPRVLGGLGTSILTTSRGVLNDREARRQKVGGEVLCSVW